jgi:hypothetical protein
MPHGSRHAPGSNGLGDVPAHRGRPGVCSNARLRRISAALMPNARAAEATTWVELKPACPKTARFRGF